MKGYVDDIEEATRANDAFRHVIYTGAHLTGKQPLKLYTLYGPPEHRDAIVQRDKRGAEATHEHFDGTTTE